MNAAGVQTSGPAGSGIPVPRDPSLLVGDGQRVVGADGARTVSLWLKNFRNGPAATVSWGLRPAPGAGHVCDQSPAGHGAVIPLTTVLGPGGVVVHGVGTPRVQNPGDEPVSDP